MSSYCAYYTVPIYNHRVHINFSLAGVYDILGRGSDRVDFKVDTNCFRFGIYSKKSYWFPAYLQLYAS